jgi:hypothetical protein
VQQNGDVLTVHFDAFGVRISDGIGLVRRLRQHRRKTEYVALGWHIQKDDLIVIVNGGYPNGPGQHDEGAFAGITDLVNSLACRKVSKFNLTRENGQLFLVEQGE